MTVINAEQGSSTVTARSMGAAWWPHVARNLDVIVGGAFGLLLVVIIVAPRLFTSLDPNFVDVASQLSAPSSAHVFGTDNVGRDVFARILYGTRETLSITVVAVLLAAFIGSIAGIAAGYLGRAADAVPSRIVDVVLSFPPLILGVIVTGTLGPEIRFLVLALAVIYAPTFFRVGRATTLSESSKLYIDAAKGLGYGASRVLGVHLVRNILPSLATQAVIVLPIALQMEAALSFIGLGVQPPTPDWGNILNEGKDYLLTAPWIALFPGLAILVTALAALLLGNAAQRWSESR